MTNWPIGQSHNWCKLNCHLTTYWQTGSQQSSKLQTESLSHHMLANWITAKQQPASMYHSVKGKWIHESINAWILDHWKPARCSGPFRLHQSPSGSVRLRRAPSGFEGPRTSAHTHPQSTLHRPSRIATLVRTAPGLVVRCGMTMPYYEGPLPSYMP